MYNMPVFAPRKQLDSVSSSANRTRSPRPPPPSSVPAPVRTSAALLANDLLDVECHLQSKVRVLEEDRQKMAAQVVELQHLLLKAEEKRQRDIEELALQHKNALCTLEEEKEELSAEVERSEEGSWQEVKAVRGKGTVGGRQTEAEWGGGHPHQPAEGIGAQLWGPGEKDGGGEE